MIRRVLLPVLVVIASLAACWLAVRPLAADAYAGRAARSEKAGRIDSAIGAYRTACELDPLNAKYWGEIGRLYLKKTRGVADTALRESSRDAYVRAIELDPVASKYRLGRAEAEALLLLGRGEPGAKEVEAYIGNLRKAVELDPTNYYVNAAAGYYMLRFRDRISPKERNFAIYRMRLALEQYPAYRNEVFSYVAFGLKDFALLEKITPQTDWWQRALRDFLRDIDRWKYRKER